MGYVYIYSAMNVACYVINYCNKKGYLIPNLKLNTYLYFIQFEFNKCDRICFMESVIRHGDLFIVREVYDNFKGQNTTIPPQFEYDLFDEDTWRIHHHIISEEDIDKQDRLLIENIIEELEKYWWVDLVRIIKHREDECKKTIQKSQNK